MLDIDVVGKTDIKGGLLAALDDAGRDSGQLSLATGSLSVSDIRDSARSRDIALGISANINDPFEEGQRSADIPVVDGSYASTAFEQLTRGTIGVGTVSVGGDSDGSALDGVNRDIDQAQQVTKDKQSGFTVYADVSAIREAVAVAKGDFANSKILQAIAAIKSLSDNQVDSSPLDKTVSEILAFISGRSAAADADLRTARNDPALFNADGTLKTAEEVASDKIAKALETARLYYSGEQLALVEAELNDPQTRAALEENAALILRYASGEDASAEELVDRKYTVLAGGDDPDVTVVSGTRTFGDDVAKVLAVTGTKIEEFQTEHPDAAGALSFTLGLILSGPAGAVGDVIIGRIAADQLAKHKKVAEAGQYIVNQTGLLVTNALVSTPPKDGEQLAVEGSYKYERAILTTGAFALNIGAALKLFSLVKKAGTAGDIKALSDIDKANSPHANVDGEAGFNDSSIADGSSDGAPKGVPAAIQPIVGDHKLQNLMDNIYKGAQNPNRVGDGTLADAVRYENATGGTVGGRTHSIKAQETIRGLQKWLDRNPHALQADRQEAISQIQNLKDALGS